MNEKEAFKFCPVCSGDLTENKKMGSDHLKCSGCSFDFFLNVKTAVSAIILNDKNKILLTKRNDFPDKGKWEVPGGFIDKNETPEEAIKREMREELNIKILSPSYTFSLVSPYKLGDILYDVLILYFTCSFNGKVKLNKESSEYKFFNLDNLPTNFHDPHLEALGLLREIITIPD